MNRSAFLYALISIGLWGSLAFLSSLLQDIPALLLTGLALCISGSISIIAIRSWRLNIRLLLVGVAGIFGYHTLYFLALRNAPTIEANLVNYLWPLLIVVLTPVFISHQRLKPNHLLGALMGLAGVGLITGGGRFSFNSDYLFGYGLAFLAALIWACYSLAIKRFSPFPTSNVGAFCLASGLLAIGLYWLQNRSLGLVQTFTFREWIFLLLMGIGPLGTAFYTWDRAMKSGDTRIIGSLSYLTPLLSTFILVMFGQKELTWISGLAMLLIIFGALIGSIGFSPNTKSTSLA